MKRLGLMLLTLALLVCGTASAYNPYAPNPFDAIEQNSWEYKYLLDLTKAGLTGADMARFSPSYALTFGVCRGPDLRQGWRDIKDRDGKAGWRPV